MFNPITITQLMSTEFADVPWLVKDLIPAECLTIISADPTSYKTWILLILADCVASGKKMFGKFDCQQGNVLIIDEENHPGMIKKRLTLLGASIRDKGHLLIREGFHADNEDHLKYIMDYIVKNNIKLVCIDSLVRIHSKEENVANQMSALFGNLIKITKTGVTVVITHHNRKQSVGNLDDKHSMRGSSDILAAIDCQLSLVAKKDIKKLVISQKKLRIAEELKPFDVDIVADDNNISFVYNDLSETQPSKESLIEEKIIDFLAGRDKASRNEIDQSVDFGKNAIGNALVKLKSMGMIAIAVKGKRNIYSLPKIEDEQETIEESGAEEEQLKYEDMEATF